MRESWKDVKIVAKKREIKLTSNVEIFTITIDGHIQKSIFPLNIHLHFIHAWVIPMSVSNIPFKNVTCGLNHTRVLIYGIVFPDIFEIVFWLRIIVFLDNTSEGDGTPSNYRTIVGEFYSVFR